MTFETRPCPAGFAEDLAIDRNAPVRYVFRLRSAGEMPIALDHRYLPRLYEYLHAALKHYKNGKRKNPIMQAQVANLTPKDMMDLAAYFSSQKALQVKH